VNYELLHSSASQKQILRYAAQRDEVGA